MSPPVLSWQAVSLPTGLGLPRGRPGGTGMCVPYRTGEVVPPAGGLMIPPEPGYSASIDKRTKGPDD